MCIMDGAALPMARQCSPIHNFFIKLVACVTVLALSFTVAIPKAYAGWFDGDNYHFHTDPGDLFELTLQQAYFPMNWMGDQQSYTASLVTDDGVGWYWNVPNLQQMVWNMFWYLVTPSGYIGDVDPDAKPDQYDDPCDTARDKFGYNLPGLTYVGEAPRVTMDAGNVFVPQNLFETVKTGWAAITGGNVVNKVSEDDLKSLRYQAPHDYSDAALNFMTLLSEHWSDVVDYCEEHELQWRVTNEETGESIIVPDDLDSTQIKNDPEGYQDHLQYLMGSSFSQFATSMTNVISNLDNADQVQHITIRMMPYTLQGLDPHDVEMYSTNDPRCVRQADTIMQMGLEHQMNNQVAMLMMGMISWMAQASEALNSICSFDFLDENAVDPSMLWLPDLLHFLMVLAIAGFIIKVVITLLRRITAGNTSFWGPIISSLCAVMLLVGITAAQEPFMQGVRTVATYCFNLGTVTTSWNGVTGDMITPHADASDRSKMRFWTLYFGPWTAYQTGHGLEDANAHALENPNTSDPTRMMTRIPTLGDGNEMHNWPAVLADSFLNQSNQDAQGNAYRAVDHYMAPTFTVVDEDTATVEVTPNPIYHGGFQGGVDVAYILANLLVLVLSLAKVALFVEFLVLLMMFVLQLGISSVANGMTGVQSTVKNLGVKMVMVGATDILITMEFVMITTLGGMGVLLGTVMVGGVCVIIFSKLSKLSDQNPWKPWFVRMIRGIPRMYHAAKLNSLEIKDDIREARAIHEFKRDKHASKKSGQ